MNPTEAMSKPPHVLIFPAPAQGHVTSMLKLAELLCSVGGFSVTFLAPAYIHRRLSQRSRSFRLLPFPHGPHRPGSFDVKDWLDSLRATAQPFLRDLLASTHDPITCVICDGILSFVLQVAEEARLPVFYMRTSSDDLDMPITNLGGMEDVLRRRDLPSCCRSGLSSRAMQTIMYETLQSPRAKGLILNTFHHLEAPTLNQISTQIPNLYTVGPLHTHLQTRLRSSTTSSSLWEEDRSCLRWLDEQPQNSVIYVSFGSIVQLTREAQVEFWHGLVNSGKRFLWVVRPESSGILTEIAEGVEQRGCVVEWAPQEDVLAHPAVGGFLTHSGWNSTMESVVAGVPMICWPHFGDQHVNSRFVGDVWKIGRDMKDCCNRVTVEKMVRDVMEERSHEFMQRAHDIAESARQSVEEGGTSYANLGRLIQDIQSLGNA